MKKIFKSRIFIFILGAILFGGIGVVSAYSILASDIGFTPKDSTWKKSNGEDITNVKDAIDELYIKANSSNNTVCILVSGEKNTVSSKYHCELGDGILRKFYILAISGDNVKLIMEKNLSDEVGNNKTISWNDALHFFDEEHAGYQIKQSWTKIKGVALPDAQDIANAGKTVNFDVDTSAAAEYFFGGSISASSNYKWLFNYTRGCSTFGCDAETSLGEGEAYGYWTKNLIYNNSSSAWSVNRNGKLGDTDISDNTYRGIRPVITLSKSNLVG